jgi:hypothetical protein
VRTLLPALTLGLAATACAPSFPDPSVASVDPDFAYNGELEQITIHGEHFYPLVELDVREASGRLDRQYSVALETDSERYSLEGVELVDYQTLMALVPEGFPAGLYTLVVTSPADAVAKLPRGFTVTDNRAEYLDVETAETQYLVEVPFDVTMAVLDSNKEVLSQAQKVRLTITDDRDAIEPGDLVIDTSRFDGAEVTEVDGAVELSLTLKAGAPTNNRVNITGYATHELDLFLEAVEEDSILEPAEKTVIIDPRSLSGVEILLPYDGFATGAGEAFDIDLRLVDDLGYFIAFATATLVLTETCGEAAQVVELQGEAQVTFSATGATSDDCPENHVLATGTVSGSSAAFQVEPGDALEYDVSVFPSMVTAWDEVALVTVLALDAYGNRVRDYGDAWFQQHGKELQLDLTDDLGGLDPDVLVGDQTCPGFEDGFQICQARLNTAGENNRITVTGEDGLQGKSGAFSVEASTLADFELDHDTPPFAAGEPFALRVRPTDAYDNTVHLDPTLVTYQFTGSPHAIECDNPTATAVSGEWSFECVATVVELDQNVTVSIQGFPGVSRSLEEGFEVRNGDLGLAVFSQPAGSTQLAGQAFDVSVQVYDAYGNPYIVQAVSSVSLSDCTGTLTPSSLAFDGAGEGSAQVTITQATEDCTLDAEDGGIYLGSSIPFDIQHGAFSDLEIELEQPWVFLDETLGVRVRAVDRYDNPILEFAEEVTLSSGRGSTTSQVLDGFELGELTIELDFDTANLADWLEASADDGITGSSDNLDVLDPDCGVVDADLLVDGDTQAVLCLSSGSVTATLDASGSSGTGLSYHFDDGVGSTLRTSRDSSSATWTEQGAYPVRLVAFDADACGDEVGTTVFVAEPDGEPAGPVTVTPVDLVRVVGSTTDGATQVDLEAFDCAGDVAAYGTLYVRSTLGEITAGASSSGQGLALVLDSAGQGQITWSVSSELHGGISSVLAGREGAVAIGSAEITAQGDDAVPVVLDVDPVGSSSEITDTITVRFDDTMRASSISDATFQFSDSLGSLDLDVALDGTGTQAEITLAAPVDLAADRYTLELSDQVRDSSGNRLDGDWDGTSSAFVVELGAVTDLAPDMSSCTPDTTVLRPDGDHVAASDEADLVVLSLTASDVAEAWRVEVYDSDGAEQGLFWHQAYSAGPMDIEWDARDQAGSILPNGSYTLFISAADAALDLGTPCEVVITIDNRVVEVP